MNLNLRQKDVPGIFSAIFPKETIFIRDASFLHFSILSPFGKRSTLRGKN